jgi:hypothetical protein
MKVGKIPVASIVLLVFALLSVAMKNFYPGEYNANSQFMSGAFFGATVVYILYYVNIYYSAWANNKKETKSNSAV